MTSKRRPGGGTSVEEARRLLARLKELNRAAYEAWCWRLYMTTRRMASRPRR